MRRSLMAVVALVVGLVVAGSAEAQCVNGVCHLRGVAGTPEGGFKLLTRGGLLPPWIEIRGAGDQIAWQTLLDGVAQIAQGDVEFEVNVGRQRARPKEQSP